ncbi:Putative Rossmann fold nucleotide-binding protein (fragment) [Cyanobium sp. NIES-981]
MAAACRGASRVEGHLVIGVLPGAGLGSERQHTAELDVALFTGMGQARNLINVLSADVVVICGAGGAGTASEAAHAIKAGRLLVLLGVPPLWRDFFCSLSGKVQTAEDAEACCRYIQECVDQP